ncbi:MAG: hypothetical protein ACREID_00900 [Planctomycetota bacterium]
MKRQALDDLRAAIEAHTERRSLDELAAQGKRHVRVVSGDRVMQLIHAIVDDAIAREAVQIAEKDRDRIVSETKQQFDRVVKMQADQDALLREQKEILAQWKSKCEDAERRGQTLQEKVGRLESELAESRSAVQEAIENAHTTERLAAKMEARLETARTTIENYDQEIGRLSARVKEDDKLLEELKGTLVARAAEVQRVEATREALEKELAATRSKSVEPEAVSQLRGELAEMKSFLQTMEVRASGSNQQTIESLLQKLEQRDAASTAQLEERFSASMDKTLDQISKTLHAATAKPIDTVVEATEALVAKMFDADAEMESNLASLEVDVRTSKSGIAGNLARLKALHSKAAAEEASDDEAQPARAAGDAARNAERLKSTRGGKKD